MDWLSLVVVVVRCIQLDHHSSGSLNFNFPFALVSFPKSSLVIHGVCRLVRFRQTRFVL